MTEQRNFHLARFKPFTEAESDLIKFARLADPDAWKYPRLENAFVRRIKSLEAASRWLAEPKPLTLWERIIVRLSVITPMFQ